jgi:hypothetical protein
MAVACLLLVNETMTPTAAIKRMMSERKDRLETDPTLLRRLQRKWKERGKFYRRAALQKSAENTTRNMGRVVYRFVRRPNMSCHLEARANGVGDSRPDLDSALREIHRMLSGNTSENMDTENGK